MKSNPSAFMFVQLLSVHNIKELNKPVKFVPENMRFSFKYLLYIYKMETNNFVV